MIDSPTSPITDSVTEHLAEQLTAETTDSPVNSKQKTAGKWLHTIGSAERCSVSAAAVGGDAAQIHGPQPAPGALAGAAHGGLFLLYITSALAVARLLQWGWLPLVLALLSSVGAGFAFPFKAWLSRTSKATA